MKSFLRITIVTAALLAMGYLVPVTNFSIATYMGQRRFVTTPSSDYCYYRRHRHGNMKDSNLIYHATLESCGKRLKTLASH